MHNWLKLRSSWSTYKKLHFVCKVKASNAVGNSNNASHWVLTDSCTVLGKWKLLDTGPLISAITGIEGLDRTIKGIHSANVLINSLCCISYSHDPQLHILFEFIKVVIAKTIIMNTNQYKYSLFEDLCHFFSVFIMLNSILHYYLVNLTPNILSNIDHQLTIYYLS